MSYFHFWCPKLQSVRTDALPWDSLIQAEQHFLTADIRQGIFSFSQDCVFIGTCACVVLQGRTPQGLGAHGHGPGQQWEL